VDGKENAYGLFAFGGRQTAEGINSNTRLELLRLLEDVSFTKIDRKKLDI
jgi:hypothetical protein